MENIDYAQQPIPARQSTPTDKHFFQLLFSISNYNPPPDPLYVKKSINDMLVTQTKLWTCLFFAFLVYVQQLYLALIP